MTDLAEAVASLYGGPLEEFVANRDALVAEVRAGGDRDLAAAIKALRKPTVAADALNRAIRTDSDAVETLLAAADRLRSTQETLLAGETAATGTDFAADQAAYRTAAEAVAANAPSHEVEVRAAIDAAAIGGLVVELRTAAFTTMPVPVGGLGPFMPGAGAAAGAGAVWPGAEAARNRADPGADDRGDPSEPSEPSAAERRMAERARKAAERALEQAEAAEAEAAESAKAAAGVVDDLDEEVAELSDRLEELRARRDDAVTARAEADAASGAAAERAAAARAVLDELTGS